jgi:hypothetical protein
MHEIDEAFGFDAANQRVRPLHVKLIPAHVRHVHSVWDTADPAAKKIQTAMQAKFFTFREQEVHAQTDAKRRRSGPYLSEKRLDESKLAEILHRVTERPHAGKNQLAGVANIIGARSDANIVSKPPKSIFDAAEIVQFVIDDSDHENLQHAFG